MATTQQTRGLVNSAWNSLGQAEAAWVRLVQAVEAMAAVRGDVEAGVRARNIAQQMHEFREVLTSWTQDLTLHAVVGVVVWQQVCLRRDAKGSSG
jgi:hypothetical protein